MEQLALELPRGLLSLGDLLEELFDVSYRMRGYYEPPSMAEMTELGERAWSVCWTLGERLERLGYEVTVSR